MNVESFINGRILMSYRFTGKQSNGKEVYVALRIPAPVVDLCPGGCLVSQWQIPWNSLLSRAKEGRVAAGIFAAEPKRLIELF